VKKYINLRPKGAVDRFFLNYQKGKCTVQPIGINKIGQYPKEIAQFLQLPNASLYTSHSFRRSSATLLANSGADITTLKRHGGWKSNSVAEGYIADCLNNKTKISKMISSTILEQSNGAASNTLPGKSLTSNNTPSEVSEVSERTELNSSVNTSMDEIFIDINNDMYQYNSNSADTSATSGNVNFHFHNCQVNISNIYKK